VSCKIEKRFLQVQFDINVAFEGREVACGAGPLKPNNVVFERIDQFGEQPRCFPRYIKQIYYQKMTIIIFNHRYITQNNQFALKQRCQPFRRTNPIKQPKTTNLIKVINIHCRTKTKKQILKCNLTQQSL